MNNPSDLLSIGELPVDRGLRSALQKVKDKGDRGVDTIIIKLNCGSGVNQKDGIVITLQLFLLRGTLSDYGSS